MTTLEKVPRPRQEARIAFEILADLVDRGGSLSGNVLLDQFNKFLAVSQPGSETAVRWGWVSFTKADTAREVWTALRKGFDNLRINRPFELGSDSVWTPFLSTADGIVWDRTRNAVTRLPSKEPVVAVVRRVFDLLTEVAPRLRVCAREDCGRFFLFDRPKQVYCSERCAQRERMARFLAERSVGPSKRRAVRGKS